MLLPPDDALTLHNAIPGSVTDGQGDFGFPCSTDAEIAVIFNGQSFSISPKDYVGPPLNGTGTEGLCQSNIVGEQVGSADQWLLGDVYLKNVGPSFPYVKIKLTLA
jgi:cathepsin D